LNWQDFLEAFDDVSPEQLHTLRRSERLGQWPEDQSFYLEIAQQMFPRPKTRGQTLFTVYIGLVNGKFL
jgi:hypothetical protein